jgi:hypothetical protein
MVARFPFERQCKYDGFVDRLLWVMGRFATMDIHG